MMQGSEASDGAAFAQALSALKERGSNLLIVGGVMEGAHPDACDRLLGDQPERPRRRVFVRTDGAAGCALAPERGIDPGRTQVVRSATTTRSVAEPASAPVEYPEKQVPEGDLGELTAAVEEAISEVAPRDGFEPAELRVCFDSLLPLFSEHDEEDVFRTLNLVTASVREVDGMAHYHLPVDADERAVALLEPLFDAVIDLRVRDGRSEHNWSLVERDVESGWLPL